MKFRLALLLFSSLLSFSAISAQDSNELRLVVQDIYRQRQTSPDHERSITELMGDGKILDTLIAKGGLTAQENAAAYYWRASAASRINSLHYFDGKSIDEGLARQALADLDKMIANAIEYPKLNATLSDALYMAGSVAKIQIHNNSLAYTYWEKCAARDHAGCLNIMANTRLTGDGGQRVDIQDAIAYHMKVFNSGIRYHCASVFSARSIAAISYFTGTRTPLGDELVWMEKSRELLDLLSAQEKNEKICGRSNLIIEEFLFNLSHGNRQEKFLDEATAKLESDSAVTQGIIGLLSGKITPLGFASAVNSAKTDPSRCTAYFDALWFEELSKNHDLAREYYQKLKDIDACSVERVYAKKFNSGAEAKAN